jgi:tetratricopeptide (TPR) repeat protein
MNKILFFCFMLGCSLAILSAQDDYPYPSLSPKGTLAQVVGNTQIHIRYERPSARKRKVFGGLVPWDKVWRTGAGHCTKIRVDRAVSVEGQALDKGTYSLFTIPNPEAWIIILNKDTSLYGSYNYNPEMDAVRFVVIPHSTDRYYETLNMDIELIPNDAKVYISWENTQVSFDIKTTTDEEIETLIRERLLTQKETQSNIYAGAAEYYLYQNTNLARGLMLADKALELDNSNGWASDLKVSIYEKLKRYDLALIELEKAMKMVRAAQYEKEAHREAEITTLKRRIETVTKKASAN